MARHEHLGLPPRAHVGEDVEAPLRHLVRLDGEVVRLEVLDQEPAHVALVARDGLDLDEAAVQREQLARGVGRELMLGFCGVEQALLVRLRAEWGLEGVG